MFGIPEKEEKMSNNKYSVFVFNVSSCSDRYCSAYGKKYSIGEMFDRVKSIDMISAVDLVMTKEFINNKNEILESINRTGLKIASVAVDHFADPIFKQGSFSSLDKSIRDKSLEDTKLAMDFAAEVDCDIVTIWPGQDGYDYLFQADYQKERQLFTEGIKAACEYRDDITITLEYKIKEPRTHCYINTVGTTLLMINDIGYSNLGVAFDYGHSALGYENPAESIVIINSYGDRLKHIHINDNFAMWDDDMIVGTVHTVAFLEFFYWLDRLKYDGYITIDQFPYREDGKDAVNESVKWIDYLQKNIGATDNREIEEVLEKKDAILSSRLIRKLIAGFN
jgi:xylose isomerase